MVAVQAGVFRVVPSVRSRGQVGRRQKTQRRIVVDAATESKHIL